MGKDACTGWPDGWPRWLGGTGTEWRHCCEAHDKAYEQGVGIWASHAELFSCVAKTSLLMAIVMFAGVATFGTLYAVHKIWNRIK